MLIVITGGAASGKSEHAERVLCGHAPEGERLYLAAMQPFGEAAARRIARHRALRAQKGFETVERYTGLTGLELPRRYGGVLLECLSNLLANECFSPAGAGFDGAETAILDGIAHLESQCGALVVVTNEIFEDGEDYPEETARYRAILARLNGVLAARADAFAESVCGILLPLKGGDLL